MAKTSFLGKSIIDDRGERRPFQRRAGSDRHPFKVITLVNSDRRSPVIVSREILVDLVKLNANSHVYNKALGYTGLVVVCGFLAISGWVQGVIPGLLTTSFSCFVGWALIVLDLGRRGRMFERLRALPFVCVACGYDIDRLNPEFDGCIACPECGGAWRRPVDAAASQEQEY